MGLVVKESGQDYEPIPEGTHHAVCYRIWDIGTQPGGQWEPKRQILIAWELPEIRIEVENKDLPKSISRRFTHSLHKKSALRPFLEMWRGKKFTEDELVGFNLDNVLSANCMIQIMHKDSNGKTYANITAALPLMRGYDKREPENSTLCWSLEEKTPIPEETPDWIEKLIKASEEWKAYETEVWADPEPKPGPGPDQEQEFDDDIPF